MGHQCPYLIIWLTEHYLAITHVPWVMSMECLNSKDDCLCTENHKAGNVRDAYEIKSKVRHFKIVFRWWFSNGRSFAFQTGNINL